MTGLIPGMIHKSHILKISVLYGSTKCSFLLLIDNVIKHDALGIFTEEIYDSLKKADDE